MKAVTSKIMAEIDSRAQAEFGVHQDILMENAGKAVASEIINDSEDIKKERVAVISGRGNNGGDGFVAARYLCKEEAGSVSIFIDKEKGVKAGSALKNFERASKMDIDILSKDTFKIKEFTVIVDAVFGTGFKGDLPDEIKKISRAAEDERIKVYSVDIPSGLDGSTGEASRGTFEAHKTISFGLAKKGFFQKDGPSVCGTVVVKDIGFPEELLKQYL